MLVNPLQILRIRISLKLETPHKLANLEMRKQGGTHQTAKRPWPLQLSDHCSFVALGQDCHGGTAQEGQPGMTVTTAEFLKLFFSLKI